MRYVVSWGDGLPYRGRVLTRRALGVVALCAALLTGCTGDDDEPADPGSSEPGRPLETRGEDGLPADFPRDEVPIVDGEVTSVTEGGAKDPGYALAVVVDQDVESALADAVGLLEDAGWTVAPGSDDTAVRVLRRKTDLAVITGTASSDQAIVSYSIDLTR